MLAWPYSLNKVKSLISRSNNGGYLEVPYLFTEQKLLRALELIHESGKEEVRHNFGAWSPGFWRKFMEKSSNRNDLAGLFSRKTRSTDGLIDRARANANEQRKPNDRAKTNSNTTQNSARVHHRNPKLPSLDPIAEAVLKAAKKELGRPISGESERELTETDMREAIARVCDETGTNLDSITCSNIIRHINSDLIGWGVLQPLIDDPGVTDIHCYDFQTVVLQRGKESELTGLKWPNQEAYQTYIDRLLLRVGKSLNTQQHTVDAALPDGKRICAMHQSVCATRGPLMTIRVQRVREAQIENLVEYGVCPPLIAEYLGALVATCQHTMIVAGETGTGKTTMLRSFGSRFKDTESIISVEDTPELLYPHPFYRSLISRSANSEGVGEVTLQEHIKATLRLCPTRVILGEMRSPEAAEAFLEAAQTGHSGLSTIHARNARETLTRLESLLGRAQRGVNVDIVRQQIALALDVVCWCIRDKETGRIRLAEVIEVGQFLEGQIQVRPLFNLVERGENPVWEVQSFSSNFDDALRAQGIYLSDSSRYIELEHEALREVNS